MKTILTLAALALAACAACAACPPARPADPAELLRGSALDLGGAQPDDRGSPQPLWPGADALSVALVNHGRAASPASP